MNTKNYSTEGVWDVLTAQRYNERYNERCNGVTV